MGMDKDNRGSISRSTWVSKTKNTGFFQNRLSFTFWFIFLRPHKKLTCLASTHCNFSRSGGWVFFFFVKCNTKFC
jgi:hypothetical protein